MVKIIKVAIPHLSSQVNRMIDEVHARRSIDGWDPYQASPTDVEASCQSHFENKVEHQ